MRTIHTLAILALATILLPGGFSAPGAEAPTSGAAHCSEMNSHSTQYTVSTSPPVGGSVPPPHCIRVTAQDDNPATTAYDPKMVYVVWLFNNDCNLAPPHTFAGSRVAVALVQESNGVVGLQMDGTDARLVASCPDWPDA